MPDFRRLLRILHGDFDRIDPALGVGGRRNRSDVSSKVAGNGIGANRLALPNLIFPIDVSGTPNTAFTERVSATEKPVCRRADQRTYVHAALYDPRIERRSKLAVVQREFASAMLDLALSIAACVLCICALALS